MDIATMNHPVVCEDSIWNLEVSVFTIAILASKNICDEEGRVWLWNLQLIGCWLVNHMLLANVKVSKPAFFLMTSRGQLH